MLYFYLDHLSFDRILELNLFAASRENQNFSGSLLVGYIYAYLIYHKADCDVMNQARALEKASRKFIPFVAEDPEEALQQLLGMCAGTYPNAATPGYFESRDSEKLTNLLVAIMNQLLRKLASHDLNRLRSAAFEGRNALELINKNQNPKFEFLYRVLAGFLSRQGIYIKTFFNRDRVYRVPLDLDDPQSVRKNFLGIFTGEFLNAETPGFVESQNSIHAICAIFNKLARTLSLEDLYSLRNEQEQGIFELSLINRAENPELSAGLRRWLQSTIESKYSFHRAQILNGNLIEHSIIFDDPKDLLASLRQVLDPSRLSFREDIDPRYKRILLHREINWLVNNLSSVDLENNRWRLLELASRHTDPDVIFWLESALLHRLENDLYNHR